MVAGDLEKVVSCWLGVVGEVGSPASLQELVEVVVLARAAVQTRGMAGTGLPGGHLSAALAQYATLLAGQGSLATALSYLGEEGVDGDQELQQLRERLQKSLARAQPAPTAVQPRQAQQQPLSRVHSGGLHGGARTSFSHSLPQGRDSRRQSVEPQFNSYNTGLPSSQASGYNQPGFGGGYSQPPVTQQPAPSQPTYTGFTPAPTQPSYTGFTPAATPNYGAPPQPSYATPAPTADPVPTFQPPPSDQTTSPSSGNHLLRRNRALDPSISPGQPGSQFGYMEPTQPSQFMQPQAPAAYSEPAPIQPTMFTPDSTPAYNQPGPGLPPPQAHVPDQPGPGFTPAVSSGAGWNDPPPMMISRPAPAQPQTSSSTAAEPITHPIFGAAAPEPTPAPVPGWGGFQPAPAPGFQPTPAPGYQGQQQQQQPQGYQGFQPTEPANQPATEPAAPEPTPPAPIPAEHQVIQDTLESLRSKCQQGKKNQ